MDLKNLWIGVLSRIEKQLPRAQLLTYFQHTAALAMGDDGALVVGLPRQFFLNWHLEKSEEMLKTTAAELDPRIERVVFRVDGALESGNHDLAIDITKIFPKDGMRPRKLPGKQEVRLAPGITSRILNPKYLLGNFIAGEQNRLAHAACSAVAGHPGQKYNPLFIYGGVGLGKTHLLQAVGNEILRSDPNKMVAYITSETFTNEVVEAIKKQKMEQLRKTYRQVDVLIIDDVQFLAGKDRTQEELFHTFNTLHEAGKQVIVSSDRPPKELPLIEERLRSRFEWGMIVDVRLPEFETRLAILYEKAAEYQAFLPKEVLEFIAFNVQHSIRELEGVLTQVIAELELQKRTPTIRSTAEILKKLNRETTLIGFEEQTGTRAIRNLDELLEIVADHFSIAKSDLLGPVRTKEFNFPRQIAMFLAKTVMGQSLQAIGAFFGGRDHTSVIHSVKKIEKELETEPATEREVNALRHAIGG